MLKTGKSERPREYIPVGLTSNHAGWDSQWFYLRNDDDLLPAYTGRLISERPNHWTYDIVEVHQSRLDPLLDGIVCSGFSYNMEVVSHDFIIDISKTDTENEERLHPLIDDAEAPRERLARLFEPEVLPPETSSGADDGGEGRDAD